MAKDLNTGIKAVADVTGYCFFFNDTATTEIYTEEIVGSVRCGEETGLSACPSLSIRAWRLRLLENP